ncbi:MAG: RidA family protein [Planctomycetes bacterium]|nr:RidA family protein [Planctomycetota bacterium]
MTNAPRTIEAVLPAGWPRPKGYANALRVPAGHDLLVLAGQIGWDEHERIVGAGFVDQFRQALRNVLTLVQAAGGRAEDIVRLTMFCADRRAYLGALPEVGAAYREVLGRHYPAMSLVEVAALVEDGALIEIEATAALAPRGAHGA